MIRVVIDTNVYVSALMFGGRPAAAVQMACRTGFEVVVSRKIRDEIEETLFRKFDWARSRVLTGDNDLLTLHPYRGIAILSPAEFVARFRFTV